MGSQQFALHFNFAGSLVTVLVTELRGDGASQYTIRPEDQILFQRYGSQTIHIFDGKDCPIGFLVKEQEEQQAFWGAVGKALRTGTPSDILHFE